MGAGGELLAGRYQLGRPLGAGALGQVFEADDRAAGGQVAVKLAHALVGDGAAGAGWLRAAREAARLAHPNVVAVLGSGEDHGVPFVVMELVEGRSLRELLRSGGPAPVGRAVELAAQVCSALGAAHALGLVHGGLTPGSVLVRPDGRVQVADFGLAAAATGAPAATPYRSPEQVQSGRGDDRSDLYALGCCLFELLTGEPPFDGPTPFVVMRGHVEEPPRPPGTLRPGLPAWLDELVLQALAKQPHERPQTAAELRQALAPRPAQPAAPAPTPALDVGVPATGWPVPERTPEAGGQDEPVVALPRATAPDDGPPAADGLPPHEERVRALTRFPEPPRRNRVALATTAAGLAILVLATLGLVAPGLVFDVGPGAASDATAQTATTAPAPPASAPTRVPAVAGVPTSEAARLLRAAGAAVGRVRLVRDPGAGKGEVLATTPPAGAVLRAGQAVDLAVSNGPDPVTVGDLITLVDTGQVGPRGRTFRGRLARLALLRGERRRLEIADLLRVARAGAGNGDFTAEFSRVAVEVLSRTR